MFSKSDPWPERALDFLMLLPTTKFGGKGSGYKILRIIWFLVSTVPCLVVAVPFLLLTVAITIWREI